MSTNKIGATPEMRDTPKFGLGLAFNLPTFSHCPHQKKKIFALKHLSDPIYKIKKKYFFPNFRGGRGGLRPLGKFPQFFFFFLMNPSLSWLIECLQMMRKYIILEHFNNPCDLE